MKLHYDDDGGDGLPVLLLAASIGTTTAVWEPVLEQLRSFRTLRIDHPGHGGSPVPSHPVSLAEYGSSVLDILDSLGVERAHVCGLSLGGGLGIWLAVNASPRVDRLVLAGTRAKFGDEKQWHQRAATVRTHGTGAITESTLDRWFTSGFENREPTRRMIESVDREGYARCCELLASIDLRRDLQRVEAPTLILRGDGDPSADPGVTKLLLAGIPGSRLQTLRDARHLPVAEQPEAFAAALREHFEKA